MLANAELIPVFFTNDDGTTPAKVVDFLQKMTNSTYWTALGEYGIRSATVGSAVTAGSASSTSDQAIPGWINQQISSGKLPQPGQNTFYLLNYPSGVTISLGGQAMCSNGGAGGYHSDDQTNNGQSYAYAVMPRCSAQGTGLGSDVDVLTLTESHEVVDSGLIGAGVDTDLRDVDRPGKGPVSISLIF